jgi:uncharacterized lipoprotein YajG
MFRIVMLSILAMIASGCAFTPQSIAVKPQVDVVASKIGNGSPLPVNVVDERPKKSLGTVGARGVGADITVEGDLVAAVHNALGEGFSRMDFKPTTTSARNGSKSELRVEIRNLDYTIIQGFWAGTLRVDAGLKAICILNGSRPYEKLHHGEFVESVQVVQGKDANAGYINTALSTAVNSVLSDKELASCLSGKQGT